MPLTPPSPGPHAPLIPSRLGSGAFIAITREVPFASGHGPGLTGFDVRMAPLEPRMSRATLLDFVRGCAGALTMFHDTVDDELLDAAGPGLRVVCNFGVGVDNIDLAACRARGVVVANTPDAVTEGTANMAIGLLLSVARRIAAADRFVRTGNFEHQGNGFPLGWMGKHLTGQTLLIVGAGRIGRAVALRAMALGMRTLYVARNRKMDFELAPLCARRVELDEGLALAHVVSLHTPLTPQTRHLIDARRIALMKPDAILINTARGPVIDEAALASALQSGHLYGAGLDVFEHEPRVHPTLLTLDNVTLTPHIGSAERYWREQMAELAFANIASVLQGGAALTPVSEG